MRVLVMMSGGVDSSVAAALLRDEGHDVVGVTLKLWGGESDTGCCSVSDVDDARRAADALGIDHHTFDFSDGFTRHVVGPYVADHALGRTPNPCIECNRHLKFDAVLERADQLGFDAIATGHHARVVQRPDGSRRVARGADAAKDQSYVLHVLGQEQLARTLLPLGPLTKPEVRTLAAQLGLRTAAKPDSQDVCFITRSAGRRAFLGERIPLRSATVVDGDGVAVGQVDAVELVTLGQRRGLGLQGGGAPRYVVDVDVAARRVVVGAPSDRLVAEQAVEGLRWTDGVLAGPLEVQCSAHGAPRRGEIIPGAGGVGTVRWGQPEPKVATGQSLVLYDGDEVVGGALAT
jgi:tRNA-specific 2-thiouridylase